METLEVLKEIRDDGRRSGERIDEINARLAEMNARINTTSVQFDSLQDDLGARIIESGLRTAIVISELSGSVRDLIAVFTDERDLRLQRV